MIPFKQAPAIAALFFLASITACFTTAGDIEREIRSLEVNQFSATGADLTLAICGWQPSKKISIKTIRVTLDRRSTNDSGSGDAFIEAYGDGFNCTGNVLFSYSDVYMGGHGTGGTSMNLGNFSRNSVVPDYVSNSPLAKPLSPGAWQSGELSATSRLLPDRALADYYYIIVNMTDPAIKVSIEHVNSKVTPRCYIYQDSIFLAKDSPWPVRVKNGKVTFIVTAGMDQSAYRIRIDEPGAEEKNSLK